jgi:ABC-type transport system substrate-binding protein
MQKKFIILATIAMFGLFLMPLVVSAADLPDREEVLYVTGYDSDDWAGAHVTFNPFHGGPNLGVTVCYLPLFALNNEAEDEADKVVPIVGKSYKWASDGSYITVELNPDAEFSDGHPIEAHDVLLSYQIYNERVEPKIGTRFSSIVAVDKDTVRFNLFSAFKYSWNAEFMITSRIMIIPAHFFQYLIDTFGMGYLTNPWGGSYWKGGVGKYPNATSEKLAPVSGPFKFYSYDAVANRWLFERRDDWWGEGKIFDYLPNADVEEAKKVKYVGWLYELSNAVKNAWLNTNEVDWHNGFYKDIGTAMDRNGFIETYYGNSRTDYVFAQSSIIGVLCNHDRFPFNKLWFRQALAYAIDYDGIESVSVGNYWTRASAICLSKEATISKQYYDAAINDEFQISYNLAKAQEILGEHCYKKTVGGKELWFTNDDEATEDDIDVKMGPTGTALLNEDNWDMDLDKDGLQVQLGSSVDKGAWNIYCPNGWSDVETCSEEWTKSFTTLLVAPVYFVSSKPTWEAVIPSGQYAMAMHLAGSSANKNPIQTLNGYIGPNNDVWASLNCTRWYSAKSIEYVKEFNKLESLFSQDQAEFKTQVKKVYTILAEEMPFIGCWYNGLWYFTNFKYWDGFMHADKVYQDFVNPAETDKQGLKCAFIMNLVQNTRPANAGGIPWSGFEIATTLGLISVVSYVLLKKRKEQ